MSEFCSRFGLRYPILQAPIGSAASPELVAAVSESGGLGSLALTWLEPGSAAQVIAAVRRRTSGPFCVNFVLAFPPRSLAAALEAGAPLVTFSWGEPQPHHIAIVRDHDTRFGVQVSNAAGAKRALDLGADFVICQGVEAGGHVQATRPLEIALPEVVAACPTTPVVAAGGLATGTDVRRAMDAGAAAAMLGTRFLATVESRAHPAYKAALVAAVATDAVLTGCFDGGWPYAMHRVLRNGTLDAWEAAGCPQSGARPGDGDIVARRAGGHPIRRYEDTIPLVDTEGDATVLALYAGTSCGAITDVRHAADVVRELGEAALATETALP